MVDAVAPQVFHFCRCCAVQIVSALEFKSYVAILPPGNHRLKRKLFPQENEKDFSEYQGTGIDPHAGARH